VPLPEELSEVAATRERGPQRTLGIARGQSWSTRDGQRAGDALSPLIARESDK
jgi:hypothetical protein